MISANYSSAVLFDSTIYTSALSSTCYPIGLLYLDDEACVASLKSASFTSCADYPPPVYPSVYCTYEITLTSWFMNRTSTVVLAIPPNPPIYIR